MLEDDLQAITNQAMVDYKAVDGNNPETYVLTFADGTKMKVWIMSVRTVNNQKQDLRDQLDAAKVVVDALKAQLDALTAA